MLDRRSFLKQSVAAGLAFGASGCTTLAPLPPLEEDVPDFSESNILRHVAGIRPYRKNMFRLELVRSSDKTIVHNYGHGGAGFTMSWGCAELACEWLKPLAKPGDEIAVIGGGVIGLTSARMLVDYGFKPRVYASAWAPNITSYFAGAQWGPSYVYKGDTRAQRALFGEILQRSYRRFERMDGFTYGVSHRLNYADEGGDDPLEHVPPGLLPTIRELDRLPFPGKAHRGKQFRTLFIEPPIFLQALTRELKDRDVVFVQKEFTSEGDVLALPQKYIVSCLGMGARRVFNDDLMEPARGQLVHLKPRPLPWLLVHKGGYIFPRSDAIILGGTFERGIDDPTPNPGERLAILERNRRFFYD